MTIQTTLHELDDIATFIDLRSFENYDKVVCKFKDNPHKADFTDTLKILNISEIDNWEIHSQTYLYLDTISYCWTDNYDAIRFKPLVNYFVRYQVDKIDSFSLLQCIEGLQNIIIAMEDLGTSERIIQYFKNGVELLDSIYFTKVGYKPIDVSKIEGEE